MNKKETYQKEFQGIDFVKAIPLAVGISVLSFVVAVAIILVRGLDYGIDFAGGVEVQVRFTEKVAQGDLRTMIDKIGLPKAAITEFTEGNEFVIRYATPEGATDEEINQKQNEYQEQLKKALTETFGTKSPEIRRVDSVGPQVGSELKRNSVLAIFYSLMLILIYIGLRFDYKYAPGAVICLFHDVVLVVGVFVLLGKEINVAILASILTLIGYSLNDTIVVFDRMRETEGLYPDESFGFVINRSINDMLSRTLITGGTTLFSSGALLFLTSGTISDIALAMTMGIIFGTYSSIYVAAPLTMMIENWKKKGLRRA